MAIRKASLGEDSTQKKKKTKKSFDSYYESEDSDEYEDYEDNEEEELDAIQWKIEKKKIKKKSSFISKEEEYERIMSREDSLSDFSRLIELEKDDLYDYVFRMTGRCDDTERIVREGSYAMQSNYKKVKTYLEFKIVLYSTARNFAADDWNGSTEKLENPGYSSGSGEVGRSSQKIKTVEKVFQSIDKSCIKEALLLRYRYMFSPSDAASIMSSSVNTVKSYEEEGLKLIASKTKLKPEDIKQTLPQFPEYSYISNGSLTTKALSQVMGSIKKDSSYRRGFWYTLFKVLVAVIIGVGIYYIYINYFKDTPHKL